MQPNNIHSRSEYSRLFAFIFLALAGLVMASMLGQLIFLKHVPPMHWVEVLAYVALVSLLACAAGYMWDKADKQEEEEKFNRLLEARKKEMEAKFGPLQIN